MSWFKNIFKKEEKETLDKGLEKSRQGFFDKITKAVIGKSKVDDEVLDDLEEILIASDVGAATTIKIIQRIEEIRLNLIKSLGKKAQLFCWKIRILRQEISM